MVMTSITGVGVNSVEVLYTFSVVRHAWTESVDYSTLLNWNFPITRTINLFRSHFFPRMGRF